MELRQFAEHVLFATTLEEKLQSPQLIIDAHPGSPLAVPETPGRPPELRFKSHNAAKEQFPGVRGLENARDRGRLLHFFANHELLATELMALVLLRFPDAPAAFRRGVLQTLKDEQEHTRMYIRRMQECGIHFGELPVSSYFWRAVSGMQNPMDYVAGLSLTFEQANLDFARYFARGFAAVGDADTAALLERVYHDEIGHVAYGLKWFRRWKSPQESDWEAFCHQLKFPLSPQRAKGISLNIAGRRACGLEQAFIDEINVYSHSKGRTPNVYVFNPFAEGRIAQGKAFTPGKHQALLGRDLKNLPQFLCRQDDIVLVEKRPAVHFLSHLKSAGFPLPEFVELEEQRIKSGSAVAHRKLGSLRPWAWGPDSVELLGALFPQVTGERRTAEQSFNERIAELYSKSWSADILRSVLSNRQGEPWLCTEQEVGVAARTVKGALEEVATIRARGHHRVVLKQALGLAGQNSLRLWEPELLDPQLRWIQHAVESGRELIVEPWLERELDFSIQLEMSVEGLKLRGYTGLINDRKGQFQANWAAPNYSRTIPGAVIRLFPEQKDIVIRIQALYAEVFSVLEGRLHDAGYRGPVGIDAFVYRASESGCRLKPIVEINPRYTMGRVTLELMKRTCPGAHGLFRLVNRAMLKHFQGFENYSRSLTERFPLRLEGEPVPRIRQGALCLNDPSRAQVCLAVFQVHQSLDALLETMQLTQRT